MSQFRGAAKEFVTYISGAAQEVTGPPASILYKRIYKMVINGNLYRADTNQSALILNSPNANAIFIIQNESTMYGGGGAGGAGGSGGTAGTGGAGNPGASTYVNGTAGAGGSGGGGGSDASSGGYDGGHCLEVTAYHAGQPLYLFNKGTLKPGGGGGGGTGGGGGSGGGGAGGSGGKGGQGRYNNAGAWSYNYTGQNPVASDEKYWAHQDLTGTRTFVAGGVTYLQGTHTYHSIIWNGAYGTYPTHQTGSLNYMMTSGGSVQFRKGSVQYSHGNPTPTARKRKVARFTPTDGGNGGYGGGGRFGSLGVYGPDGKKGAYYNGTAEVTGTTNHTAVTGGAIQGTASTGTAGGGSTGITTYNWDATGAGGNGGNGGKSRAGHGYSAGGGGGDFGAAGTAGGNGVDGTTSYSEGGDAGGDGGLKTGDENPWTQRTVGGTGGSGNHGGAGSSGKPGGTGGQKLVLPSGITTVNRNWT
jgi:hypothetical protein